MTGARITPGLDGVPAEVDVVVVGLGITGAGVALDAVTRGLSVLAVDAHDLAFGTSRWSSKLVHGGLRYLAQGQLAIAHESAVERGVLMDVTAPHLVRPLPMLTPVDASMTRGRTALTWAGLRAGDALRRTARTTAGTLPAPAGSTPPRRSGSSRRCVPTPCAAGCSPGTGSSRTTPGWSSPSPAPQRRTAPRCAPAPG